MRVNQVTTLDALGSLAGDWSRLTSCDPFLSPQWLHTWWQHVGATMGDTQLSVLCVRDDREQLVAIAPWYLERSVWRGRTLRFLGSGEVCSEYMRLPCRPGLEQPAVQAIAEWLHEANQSTDPQEPAWDVLWLEAVDTDDPTIKYLYEALDQRGAITHSQPASDCWRLDLPASWEEYLSLLSKSHRKRVRRLQRAYFDSGRAEMIRIETVADLEEGYQVLVDLHERRWASQGAGGGIFSQDDMFGFHRDATQRLLESGQLWLNYLKLDGEPVAAEYSLHSDGVLYAYQSGMAPEAQPHEPGTLALMATLRTAIEEGYRTVDFLRGDEPYKQHWRAVPKGTHDVRILRPGIPGHLRHTIWQAGSFARSWLRAGRDVVREATRTIQAKPFLSLPESSGSALRAQAKVDAVRRCRRSRQACARHASKMRLGVLDGLGARLAIASLEANYRQLTGLR